MKKIICLALAVLMIATAMVAFSACGKEEELVMATNAAFPPYEYKDDNGEFAGIDIEIAQAIAEKLGMKLKIEDVDFDTIVAGVESGKFTMGMAGMTVTEERKQSVNFSTTYAKGIQVVIVKEGSSITAADDFFNLDAEGNWVSLKDANTKVGVQQGTTGDIYASSAPEDWGFGEGNVVRYKTGAEAIQALNAGKVDAVIIDNEPAKAFVAANAGLKILAAAYADEDYAICVNKENTELLEKINQALKELKEEGKLDEIVNKYIPAN